MRPRPDAIRLRPAKGDLYLDTRVIQSGDVLLELGEGSESAWIAKASGGPFSHAALVVNPYFLFESEDQGVGYTPLNADRVERRPSGTRILSRLRGVESALVLRFQRLTAKRARDLGDDLVAALGRLDGKQYPEWSALASAAPGGWLGTQVGRVMLSIADWYQQARIVLPGPFCSELIAAVFADVMPRRKLFDEQTAAKQVNPNTFLRSRLVPIADAVCEADLSAPIDKQYADHYNAAIGYKTRRQATGRMVGFRVNSKKLDMSLDSIKSDSSKIRKIRKMLESLEKKRCRAGLS